MILMAAMFTIPSHGSCLWHWVFHSHNETWPLKKKNCRATGPQGAPGDHPRNFFGWSVWPKNLDVALYKTGWPTPSYTLWLCQNSYWKWPFIVDFPIKNCDFPISYVSLPEGKHLEVTETNVTIPWKKGGYTLNETKPLWVWIITMPETETRPFWRDSPYSRTKNVCLSVVSGSNQWFKLI